MMEEWIVHSSRFIDNKEGIAGIRSSGKHAAGYQGIRRQEQRTRDARQIVNLLSSIIPHFGGDRL